ncbi:hypothetical protein B0A55_11625 [Friedmanniomyces simplex]|uniref:F-box domain-containing protein n=1 Tax=Friedmanniomyces simplex TaxID=329884 RepID=A0A4U0WA19_9PEZI|nr:hypothetical protein B0A55_11625 [Friedmanniomyces simplex]
MIENTTQGDMQDDEQMALPMHPICFQLFQRVSRSKLGKVEIDGLWRLREAQGHYSNRFKDFPESPDLTAVSEQWYDCVPGTEYLTSNPLQVQGLSELIETCERDTNQVSDVVLDPGRDFSHVDDVLAILSPELRHLLLHHLGRRDVANLRLASSSFRQLPQVYFHRIVETKMPWVWELDNFKGRRMDWYTLWRKLSAANGGAGIDEQERNWRRQVPLQKYAKARETLGANDRMDGRECRREADAEIKAGYEAGMWPPRASDAMQLRGLRNRRRSLEDLQEIFRRIAALPPDDDSEELE